MQHPRDLLDDAEKWLGENKRAGAVNALIDVCRQQQTKIEEYETRLRAVESYATRKDLFKAGSKPGVIGDDGVGRL